MKDKVDMKLNNVFEGSSGMKEHNNLINTMNKEESDFFGLGGLIANGSVSSKYKGADGPNSIKFNATIAKNQIHINAGIAGSPVKKKNGQLSYPVNRMVGRFDSHQGSYKYYGAGFYKDEEVRTFMVKYNVMDNNLVSNQYLLTSPTQSIRTPYELKNTNRLALGNIYACLFNQLSEAPAGVTNNYSLVVDSQDQQYDDLITKYSVAGAGTRYVTLIPHNIPNTELGIIFITDRQ